MKSYTPEQKNEARGNLPKPIAHFIASQKLAQNYQSLAKKHSLNLRHIGIISEIVEVILLGLEQEREAGMYIRSALPELPEKRVQDLVGDIDIQIFKKARQSLVGDATTDSREDVREEPKKDAPRTATEEDVWKSMEIIKKMAQDKQKLELEEMEEKRIRALDIHVDPEEKANN